MLKRSVGLLAILSALVLLLLAGTPSPADEVVQPHAPPGTRIDTFGLADGEVLVDFFDPRATIEKASPGFGSQPEDVKFRLWDAHLRNAALFLFQVRRERLGIVYAFVLRGDPTSSADASRYQLEVVSAAQPALGNPNETPYADRVVARISVPGVRGSLFEHMFPEAERTRWAGVGIKMYGKFVRVTPYAEVKRIVSREIEKYLADHP